mmetsp:Transcript_6245/g.11103  ORF Transcript_6245/g.11103 Transcript_6245/m.11103 type:complete len:270 (+) Transcript_6245:880-1689(+)
MWSQYPELLAFKRGEEAKNLWLNMSKSGGTQNGRFWLTLEIALDKSRDHAQAKLEDDTVDPMFGWTTWAYTALTKVLCSVILEANGEAWSSAIFSGPQNNGTSRELGIMETWYHASLPSPLSSSFNKCRMKDTEPTNITLACELAPCIIGASEVKRMRLFCTSGSLSLTLPQASSADKGFHNSFPIFTTGSPALSGAAAKTPSPLSSARPLGRSSILSQSPALPNLATRSRNARACGPPPARRILELGVSSNKAKLVLQHLRTLPAFLL